MGGLLASPLPWPILSLSSALARPMWRWRGAHRGSFVVKRARDIRPVALHGVAGLGLAVLERWHHGEWDACGDGGAWRTRMHPRASRYHQLARLTRFRGAKREARRRQTPGDVKRCPATILVLLLGTSGHGGRRPAMARARLTSEGHWFEPNSPTRSSQVEARLWLARNRFLPAKSQTESFGP